MTPRRIPTDKIEVGRWYRVEDAVPEDGELEGLQQLIPWEGGRVMVGTGMACALSEDNAAWRYNGPIPDTLPPREEKPKRFRVGEDRNGDYAIRDGERFDEIVAVFSDDWQDPREEAVAYCTLLNAGHEALEAEREGGAS